MDGNDLVLSYTPDVGMTTAHINALAIGIATEGYIGIGSYDFSFAEYPQKQKSQILINDSQIDYTTFKKMEIELKKTKKELQKYELNKVGEQQQKFIE